MASVYWSVGARKDVRAIHAYIAQDSLQHADAFIASIERAVQRLELFPESGRVMPEEPSGRTREVIHRDYRIAYIVLSDRVMIVGDGSLDI